MYLVLFYKKMTSILFYFLLTFHLLDYSFIWLKLNPSNICSAKVNKYKTYFKVKR